MIRTKNRMRLCVTLLVCCLTFIWGNSLLPGSVSGAISDFVKNILAALFEQGEPEPESSGFLLRKLAHFTEFTALGRLAACVDESIQIFVPDRGPSLRDVCIDSGGVLLGVILLTLGHHYLCKKRRLEET